MLVMTKEEMIECFADCFRVLQDNSAYKRVLDWQCFERFRLLGVLDGNLLKYRHRKHLWLNINLEKFLQVVSEDDIMYLSMGGLFFDEDIECFVMKLPPEAGLFAV